MDVTESESFRKFLGRISKLANPIAIDLGCGGGGRLCSLLEKCPNLTAIGLDIDAEAVMNALRGVRRLKLRDRADFVLADAHFIPVRERVFHCAIIIHVLYLIPSFARIAKELASILKENGLILIIEKTFSPRIACALYRIIRGRLGSHIFNRFGADSLYGRYFLTSASIVEALTENSFTIVKYQKLTYMPMIQDFLQVLPSRFSSFLKSILLRIEYHLPNTWIGAFFSVGTVYLCVKSVQQEWSRQSGQNRPIVACP